MKTFLMHGIAAVLLLAGTAAHAISLGFSPTDQAVGVGSSVDVDLVISGLGDFMPDSLGVFDLDVLYDSAILGLTNVAFGDPGLGDQLDLFGFGSFTGVGAVAGGTNLFEISFDSPLDLDTLQPGSFTLARLTFDVLAQGKSPLDLANVLLGDAGGNPLSATVTPGSIAGIPEPGTITLFLMGGLALGFAVRRTAA